MWCLVMVKQQELPSSATPTLPRSPSLAPPRCCCCCCYNTIQYKHEYYYSGINPIEFRSHVVDDDVDVAVHDVDVATVVDDDNK